MNIDQHLRIFIGDLVITIARLNAENDALKAGTPPTPPQPPPEPTSGG